MQTSARRWTLYVLKLEQGKWYVGITTKKPEERFHEHLAKKRSAYWTMRYRPLEIELVEDLGVVTKEHAEEYENKITRSLMKERGINNVRGGDLTDETSYVVRFGKRYDETVWGLFSVVVLEFLIIIAMVMDKYI